MALSLAEEAGTGCGAEGDCQQVFILTIDPGQVSNPLFPGDSWILLTFVALFLRRYLWNPLQCHMPYCWLWKLGEHQRPHHFYPHFGRFPLWSSPGLCGLLCTRFWLCKLSVSISGSIYDLFSLTWMCQLSLMTDKSASTRRMTLLASPWLPSLTKLPSKDLSLSSLRSSFFPVCLLSSPSGWNWPSRWWAYCSVHRSWPHCHCYCQWMDSRPQGARSNR